MNRLPDALRRMARAVPAGVELSDADWDQRHRWILGLLWFHVPAIVVFAFARGFPVVHNVSEAMPVAALAASATWAHLARRSRAIVAALGLMVSSAVLVHLSGGSTEMHFHFFVMVGVISLYQDWRPFLVAIGFVAAHHAVMGSLRPRDVFDHSSAWNEPLEWAAIHAFFVLCASAVSVVSWRIIEDGHRRSRAALEESERRFRALIENATEGVTVLDPAGVIIYDSPSCFRILGYTAEERAGMDGVGYIHPDDVERALETLQRSVADAASIARLEVRVRHRDGSYRWIDTSLTNLVDEPAVGGLVANFRDVTERKMLEGELAHQAFHDTLTGLANRALLLDHIQHACESARRRGDVQVGVLYLDLDDFKTVNDALGHDAGDELLQAVAARIAAILRPGDTAARLGGDEFAVLLEDVVDATMAYETGARLIDSLRAPFDVGGESVSVGASLGIAVSSRDDDAVTLLRNADLAMYRAKSHGKGRFEIYESGMHAAVLERMGLKADLRRAIAAEEFEPHYQPIVDLGTGSVVGVEALARWQHPTRGIVAPAAFIPLAEETGLIVPIGRQILRRACLDAAGWPAENVATLSVNLSARQVQDRHVVQDVTDALAVSGLSPARLTLEVTESVLLQDTAAAADVLAALKDLGVRIALDDFGTGYSSLGYLDRFPVDIVKIDKSFIDRLVGAEASGSALVRTIVGLGALLGLEVTAEGIEGLDQLDRLREIGCHRGQGFYFARPMPVGDLLTYLSTPQDATATSPSYVT